MKLLITGAAGFIGARLTFLLAQQGHDIVAIDNINDYYDIRLKYGRLAEIGFFPSLDGEFQWGKAYASSHFPNCRFIKLDIADKKFLDALFITEHFDKVVNLAAQAGVRYSITNPYSYMRSNLEGFLNILEACRNNNISHLIFASSSSVYGMNTKVPYCEDDKVDTPVSLYAASKKSNELMAHVYSKLYGVACTGLRFFTVYGPWGRPDMAPMLFAKAITNGTPIKVFNKGDMIRDFTFVDDIVEGTIHVINHQPIPEDCPNGVPYKIYNIGCSHPVRLMDFISEMEQACGRKAVKEFLPMQPGDVYQTFADTSKLEAEADYKPHISLHEGIALFMQWYNSPKNPLR